MPKNFKYSILKIKIDVEFKNDLARSDAAEVIKAVLSRATVNVSREDEIDKETDKKRVSK